jgi:tetratricopeptide (TPR) repeat protein
MSNQQSDSSPQNVGREYIECDSPVCSNLNPSKRCSRCHLAYYCSATCQRAHFPEHRNECHDINKMRELQSGIIQTKKDDVPDATTVDDNEKKNDQCFICLDEPIQDKYNLPQCGHSFCFGCLQKWQEHIKKSLSRSPKLTCPACRADMPDIEKAMNETAMLYAERARGKSLSDDEKRKYHEMALAELKKVDESIDIDSRVQALATKTDVLMKLNRPADALKALEEMEQVHEDGMKNYPEIKRLIDLMDAAENEGRHEDSDVIIEQLEALKDKNVNTKRLEVHSLYELYLSMGEAKEAMEDWEGARDIYKYKLFGMTPERGTPPQERRMYMGVSRCLYHLGKYEFAIELGGAAIMMNRHFPQVHKYVALSQKALGNNEDAVRTMAKAVNYETPWDEVNKKIVLEMYDEMKNSLI